MGRGGVTGTEGIGFREGVIVRERLSAVRGPFAEGTETILRNQLKKRRCLAGKGVSISSQKHKKRGGGKRAGAQENAQRSLMRKPDV